MTTVNAYTTLHTHMYKHQYKRGANKGSAPLDARRRSRSHEIVRKDSVTGFMIVQFHNTDLITVTPNNIIIINTRSWHSSPTTRVCFENALRLMNGRYCGWTMTTMKKHGIARTWVQTPKGSWPFADGMTFDAEGKLLSEPPTLEAKRINKEESKEFQKGLKDSGFKDTFPILFATTPAPDTYVNLPFRMTELANVLTDADQAHLWPQVIQYFAYERSYNWQSQSRDWQKKHVERRVVENGVWRYEKKEWDYKKAWAAIMRQCKMHMYEYVPASSLTTSPINDRIDTINDTISTINDILKTEANI